MSAALKASVLRRFSSLVCLSLVLASCSYIDRMMGSDRTEPDGGQNSFGTRQRPVLNPGGTLYRSGADMNELAEKANNPYLVETGQSQDLRRMPVANQPQATYQAVPAAPVAVTPMPAAQPQSAAYAPRMQVADAGTGIKKSVKPGGYPALSATPPNPARPSDALQQERVRQMKEQQELAAAAQAEMQKNPELAQMQRDAAMASGASTTTVAVNAPAKPVPLMTQPVSAAKPQQEAMSESGFSSWLNRTFSSDANENARKGAQPRTSLYTAAPSTVSSTSATAPAPSRAVTASASRQLEPIHLVPPPDMDMADAAAPQPVATTPASAPRKAMTMASIQPLEPIRLTPPPSVKGEGSLAQSDDGLPPIQLTAPLDIQPQGRYLADNRYAARRARATQ